MVKISNPKIDIAPKIRKNLVLCDKIKDISDYSALLSSAEFTSNGDTKSNGARKNVRRDWYLSLEPVFTCNDDATAEFFV